MLIKTYDESAEAGERLIHFDVDKELLRTIEKALGNMKGESRKVLKNAVNATARQARTALIAKTKEEYAVKKGPLSKATKVSKKASVSAPEATITVKGPAQELREFRTSTSKSGVKAKVRNSSSLKLIQSETGSRAKAFLATFGSGHTAIVQRQEGETYRRDGAKRQAKYGRHIDMTRLKKLLSISFPKMVGGSAVLGALAPDIYDTLLENVNKEIRRVMRT